MKGFTKIALAATLVAGASARHTHGHAALNRRELKAAIAAADHAEKRAVVIETAYGPAATVYELDGEIISAEQAQNGIDNGNFVVVKADESPVETATAPVVSAPGAKFYELKETTSEAATSTAVEEPTTTSTPPAVTTTSKTTTSQTSSSKKSSPTKSVSSGTGLDSKFPSGEIDCSEFPSSYGALSIDWMGLGGWSGIQNVPSYSISDLAISYIETAVSGGCTKNSFCSYACPPGYQKTQWPSAQGSTLQSIGGLYCNSKGKLELSRENYDTLCEKGAGGVTIQNDLSVQVATCRTDYPGTENMVIPILATAGASVELTNPDANTYYNWDGKTTTAQYYINKAGYSVEDACCWTSKLDPKGAGNWSPMNIGVGQNADGNTFIGIFYNLPTSSATLDFDVSILIDGEESSCCFKNGAFPDGGNGCTAAMKKGSSAVVRYH